MSNKKIMVNCPTCKKSVIWDDQSKFRPFCRERCQQIDLGAWASDTYSIPTEPTEQDFALDQDPSDIPLSSSPYTLQ